MENKPTNVFSNCKIREVPPVDLFVLGMNCQIPIISLSESCVHVFVVGLR